MVDSCRLRGNKLNIIAVIYGVIRDQPSRDFVVEDLGVEDLGLEDLQSQIWGLKTCSRRFGA
jgi:hypothetical protein